MAVLSHPTVQKEESLRTSLSGGAFVGIQGESTFSDLVVVSGYASVFDEELTGSDKSDYKEVLYQIEMQVGPTWRSIWDVSPIVTPSGFVHFSSDEADATGYSVDSCTWDLVQSNGFERIQLTAGMKVRGGQDGVVLTLAYHLTAIGNLAPDNANPL